jgi:hypothetical protein
MLHENHSRLIRKQYDIALKAITDPEKQKQFKDEWQDGISSLNNISDYAHQLAENIYVKIKGSE